METGNEPNTPWGHNCFVSLPAISIIRQEFPSNQQKILNWKCWLTQINCRTSVQSVVEMLEDWAKRKPMQLSHEEFKTVSVVEQLNTAVSQLAEWYPCWKGHGNMTSTVNIRPYCALIMYEANCIQVYIRRILNERSKEINIPFHWMRTHLNSCVQLLVFLFKSAVKKLSESNQGDQDPAAYGLWWEAEIPGFADKQQLQAEAWVVSGRTLSISLFTGMPINISPALNDSI